MSRKSKLFKVLGLVLIATLLLVAGCGSSPKEADKPAEKPAEQSKKPYFEGKNLTILVAYSPGGAHDTMTRTLAPYIKEVSGAKNVLVVNKKGGGGVVGMNELWKTEPNGETITLGSAPTHILSYVAGNDGVEWDPTKSTWLAQVANRPILFTVSAKSGMKNAEDMKNLSRPFIFPSQGLDDDFYTATTILDSLGVEFKVASGFESEGEIQLAQVQGTVDGLFAAYERSHPLVKEGNTVPIMILNDKRVDWEGYQDIPTVIEVVGDGPGKQAINDIVTIHSLYQSMWGPPGMSEEATNAWREILDKVLTNPEVLGKMKKIGGNPSYTPGAELQKLIPQVVESAKVLKPTFDKATASVK
ncbi:MAG: Bug family tripartite tricarboxylate transporter substrate binding protein [Bacillota bacterium]